MQPTKIPLGTWSGAEDYAADIIEVSTNVSC